ncbi:MAG TPA: IS21 family transposase [Thermoclostridium sp.]|nr:IS21 family transposase [Thermoclostridium sp.]
MVQYDYIRYLYFNKEKSKRAIAKEVGVHRNTVTKAIENPEQKYNLIVQRDRPINHDFEERVKWLMEDNQDKPRKHRLTKTRMYNLMCDEGYHGSYSAFTYLTRQIEEELNINSKEAFLKLNPIKGSMQVDFGEITVIHNNMPRKIYVFCAKLCYSKVEFVIAYPYQRTEYFFDGLNAAFAFFGGVPRKIIFDNLKPAVKQILEGANRELQEEFLKFKSFYCFEAIFCAPGKGNEKGLIENLVKYVRNNYFLPYINFTGFSYLNSWLLKECRKRLEEGSHKGEAWTKLLLREEFLPFEDVYKYARIQDATVDTYQLIHVERNRYSVPTRYVGKRVQVKIYPFKITASYKGEIIATHDRLFGRDKEYLNPYHYLLLLRKKARGYDQAKVIQDWKLPVIYGEYHRQLKAHRQSNSKGTREFIDILKLTEEYGLGAIGKILNQLDKASHYSYQSVLSLLRCQTEYTSGTKPLAERYLDTLGIGDVRTSHLPLVAYDSLANERGHSL